MVEFYNDKRLEEQEIRDRADEVKEDEDTLLVVTHLDDEYRSCATKWKRKNGDFYEKEYYGSGDKDAVKNWFKEGDKDTIPF